MSLQPFMVAMFGVTGSTGGTGGTGVPGGSGRPSGYNVLVGDGHVAYASRAYDTSISTYARISSPISSAFVGAYTNVLQLDEQVEYYGLGSVTGTLNIAIDTLTQTKLDPPDLFSEVTILYCTDGINGVPNSGSWTEIASYAGGAIYGSDITYATDGALQVSIPSSTGDVKVKFDCITNRGYEHTDSYYVYATCECYVYDIWMS